MKTYTTRFYKVRKIVKHKVVCKKPMKVFFLVKWKGYKKGEWLPKECLSPNLYQSYWKHYAVSSKPFVVQ